MEVGSSNVTGVIMAYTTFELYDTPSLVPKMSFFVNLVLVTQ